MMGVIIIPPRIMRPAIRIPTMTMDRRMKGLPYALALAIMTRTAHATTAVQYTATGIDLRRARIDASVASAIGGCADALKACD